jgi:hypothetical protein
VPCDLEAQCRLADASDTGQRDEPVLGKEAEDLLDLGVSADEFGDTAWKVSGGVRRSGNARRYGANRSDRGVCRARTDLPRELITPSGYRQDQVVIRPEGLAQRRDLVLQSVFFDDPARPHPV